MSLSNALSRQRSNTLPPKTVVLTADDGPILDYADFLHPTCGFQKSLLTRLREFRALSPNVREHDLHLSVFAIASPDARAELDRTDYMSLGVWPDDWWLDANQSGLICVENHSWDHNHASLQRTVQRHNERGHSHNIETWAEAYNEVERASDFIELKSGRRPKFFAYLYGHASHFLKSTYFPSEGPKLGLDGALGTEPAPVTEACPRWCLPRLLFGRDWRRPDEFRCLLKQFG
jgi:peptidoglycan/xylan/chitin deacetylase (PgdA/CDA1 family)